MLIWTDKYVMEMIYNKKNKDHVLKKNDDYFIYSFIPVVELNSIKGFFNKNIRNVNKGKVSLVFFDDLKREFFFYEEDGYSLGHTGDFTMFCAKNKNHLFTAIENHLNNSIITLKKEYNESIIRPEEF